MTKLDKKIVKKTADLAMLELTEEELELFSGQIGSILDYVKKLDEVDTSKVEYKPQVEFDNVMQDDEPEDGFTSEQSLSGSKKVKGKYFEVPNVIKK